MFLVGATYVWFVDPWNIRPLLQGARSTTLEVEESVGERVATSTRATVQHGTEETAPIDAHPSLSPAQEEALGNIGVDVGKLPTTITPVMEACFTEKLGAARVAEIKSGVTPTAFEVAQTLPCVGQ